MRGERRRCDVDIPEPTSITYANLDNIDDFRSETPQILKEFVQWYEERAEEDSEEWFKTTIRGGIERVIDGRGTVKL